MDLYEVSAKGFGPFLDQFCLKLNSQGLVWVTARNNDTRSADNNGSGKTHLFKAIGWCLYGQAVDGFSGDEVIHERAKRAEVTCKFGEDSEKLWTLTRWRTKGSPRLKLISPAGDAVVGKREDIQNRVISMLGMDFVAFRNTSMYGQGDVTRFAHPKTTDSQRKEVLQRITRTGIFQHCKALVDERAKETRVSIGNFESESRTAKGRLEEHDVERLKELESEWEDQRTEGIEKLKREAKQWRDEARECEEHEDTTGLEADIDELSESMEAGSGAADKLEELDASIDACSHKLAKLQRLVDKAEINLDKARESLERLDGDQCPLCTAPLGQGAAHEHVEELKGAVKLAKSELNSHATSKNKAQKELEKLVEKREPLKTQVRNSRLANVELLGKKEHLARIRREIEQSEERRLRAIEQARGCLLAAKSKTAEINPYATQVKEARTRVKQLTRAAEKWDREAEAARSELSYLEFWSRGFSNQGLPSFILDAIMPYLTERANHYLRTLADGDIAVEFNTQRELKSTRGEYRDEISIRWTIEGATGKPPSGGQLKKIDLAVDFALMDLMASREGGRTNVLVLDEVLDGLDAEGRNRVLLLLQELRSRVASIFVISHDPDMAEIFEKSIEVVKDGGSSTLRLP